MATLSSTGRFAAGEACANNDILYGPYATTAAAHAALLNAEQNVVGRTVGIQTGNTIEEYWYQGGTTEQNLVKKQVAAQEETDPTVPSWAKQQNKPSYDYSEIGNTPDLSGFITKSVNDLANYYLKSETYTKVEVAALIGAIQQFHYEVYASLPQSGESNVLYLIGPTGSGSDRYEEYVYANNAFTKIGDTSIDLSGYVTTSALNTALADYTTTSNLTALLSNKVDKVANATNGNFAGLDANGNLTDSGKKESDFATSSQGAKADTAVQSVTVGTTTTGAAGTNASVTNSGTATNPVLDFTIPRGAKGDTAINPFKGYWANLSALKAAHTAVNGDYAYVADQSPATTVSLYAYDSEAATDNYWSDTGIDMSITDMESIFSFSAKNALLDLLKKAAYIDQNGAQYIDTLRTLLLFGEVSIVSISAAYDQGDDVVFTSDSLAKLRNYLTVTATYSNGSTEGVNNYELSGTLSAGANTITVTCGEVSTTFSVTAVDVTGYIIYDYVATKQTYPSGSVVRNIRLKQYPNLNVLSCKFKCNPIVGHPDGHTIFGARTSGETTHTNSYAFYAHTGALGYHLHGIASSESVHRPPMNEGQINIVEYINTPASPSEVVTNNTNHQQITWDNNNTLNLKPSLFSNPVDENNEPVFHTVEMGWLIFLDLNGDKVSHYLPAVRSSDSVIGMLDIIDGTFYTAATTDYAKIGNSNCMYKVGNW